MNTVTSTSTATATATSTATSNLFHQYRTYEAIIALTNAILEFRSNERDLELIECFLYSNNELTVTIEYSQVEDDNILSVTEVYCFAHTDLLAFDISNVTELTLWKHRRF
jgi:hypothetical protein